MKHPHRRQFLNLAAGAASLSAVSHVAKAQAQAQAYPTRPIIMIGPYAAGGSTDVIGRVLAERMRASLGQPVIMENVVGGGGSIGVGRAARSAADGYTLSIGQWGSHVVNGAIYSLPYDLLTDFEPIALLVHSPMMLVVRTTMPAKNLEEFVAWLKTNPGKASAGNSGVGGASHIAAVFFQNASSTRFGHVPYRGGGPAIQDLVAGHIDLMAATAGDALTHVRAGSIKAYAIMANKRLDGAPSVPTVDEAGLPGLYVSLWHGLWAPRGTPKDIVAKVGAAVVEALADANVVSRLATIGQEIYPREQQNSVALAAFHKAEIDKWWPIVKSANIKAE
jgi:tripartite-type tricarboxylate transporter receptor subunit TctC